MFPLEERLPLFSSWFLCQRNNRSIHGNITKQLTQRTSDVGVQVMSHNIARLPVWLQTKRSAVVFLEVIFSTFVCGNISVFEQQISRCNCGRCEMVHF